LDQNGAYGVLGFGPESPLWEQYLDPKTNSTSYFISQEDAAPTVGLGASPIAFNLTLCPSDKCSSDSIIDPTTTMNFTESNNWSSFTWSTFGFGKTYYDNGAADSDYFENFSDITNKTIQFNINTNGAQLPTDIWNQFLKNLKIVIDDIECSTDANNNEVCKIPSTTCAA